MVVEDSEGNIIEAHGANVSTTTIAHDSKKKTTPNPVTTPKGKLPVTSTAPKTGSGSKLPSKVVGEIKKGGGGGGGGGGGSDDLPDQLSKDLDLVSTPPSQKTKLTSIPPVSSSSLSSSSSALVGKKESGAILNKPLATKSTPPPPPPASTRSKQPPQQSQTPAKKKPSNTIEATEKALRLPESEPEPEPEPELETPNNVSDDQDTKQQEDQDDGGGGRGGGSGEGGGDENDDKKKKNKRQEVGMVPENRDGDDGSKEKENGEERRGAGEGGGEDLEVVDRFIVSPGIYRHYKRIDFDQEQANRSAEDEHQLSDEQRMEEIGMHYYNVTGTCNVTKRKGERLVICQPLFKSSYVYQNGRESDGREINVFLQGFQHEDGTILPRFEKVTDVDLLATLEQCRTILYDTPVEEEENGVVPVDQTD